jgi:ABC-2 type transport system permease protein
MKANERSGNLVKFFIYLVVVILINVAGFTLFFRLDMTSNKAFSLSDVSKKAVSTLKEPLTIYVFFTKNLPAPYNSVEKYLHDLLEEYALSGNKYFNYRFYDVSTQEGALDKEIRKNQELAESYGIRPMQIQVLEQDEFKFKMAYMGLVIMHGDLVERIPAISSTDRLEYKLTTTIQKLNNKISSFQKLDGNIKVKLFLSSSLDKIAPFIGVESFSGIPAKVSEIIEKLKGKSFGKLEYLMLDPSTDPSINEQVKKYKVMTMEWPDLPEKSVAAGKGSIGIFVEYKDNALEIPLLQRFQIPGLGTQQMNTIYQLVDMAEVEEAIQKSIESLIDINESLGYLSDHGCINLWGRDNMPGMPSQGSISRFNEMASQTYTMKEVKLTDRDILNGLSCLMITSPKEPFTDYELFRIDQFLMQGKSIALFMDSFEEIPSQQGGEQYKPIDTGLEKLLNHWGINIEKSIVLDQECYKAELPAEYGGGEQPLYYVSQVRDEFINKKLPFIKDIRGLLVQKSSPVVLDEKLMKEKGLTIHKLFSSSEKSWEMKEPINLNPMMMRSPSSDTPLKSIPLAYTIEGAFTSYFADKPVPEAVMKKEEKGKDEEGAPKEDGKEKIKKDDKPAFDAGKVKSEEKKIEKGKPGKIFITGTSYLLDNSVISPEGGNVNSIFVLNLLDYLNGKEPMAVMRSKTGSLNPLAPVTPWAKSAVKFFNIIGLPVIVVMFGLFIWFIRHRRKLAIQDAFKKPVNIELKENLQ